MTDIFFYGTLCHRPLLDIVLGRQLAETDSSPAILENAQVNWVDAAPYPMIRLGQDGRIAHGLLARNLSEVDIARLNFYEGGFDYDLVPVTLSDGAEAKVFLPGNGVGPFGDDWSLTDWAQKFGDLSCRAANEAMGYFGQKTASELAFMLPMIRARAWSHINAVSDGQGEGTFDGAIDLQKDETAYAHFFSLRDLRLRFERFDGTMSDTVDRAVFMGSDAATVLPYDPVRDRVLVIEQVRAGAIARGDPRPWQLEPIAGRIDAGETPEDTARREAMEEAGITLGPLEAVAACYPSPGACSEYIYAFVAPCDLPDDIVTTGGGLEEEAEDIRSFLLDFEAFIDLLDSCQAANGVLVMTGYWLARHRARLRKAAAKVTSG